ncbi:MAG: hypothetical protein V4440_10340 [Pseudomonadota bacterium]
MRWEQILLIILNEHALIYIGGACWIVGLWMGKYIERSDWKYLGLMGIWFYTKNGHYEIKFVPTGEHNDANCNFKV